MCALNIPRIAILIAAFVFVVHPAQALTLYSTTFEEFTAGNDRWAGTNGWVGTSIGAGVHGIDQEIQPGLGKTAFLGFKRPNQTFVTVTRPLLYNPITNARPIIQFETLMGIEDSTNGNWDSFFFTVYNNGGKLLGAIRFDNTELNYGIWRLNGTNQIDTGFDFLHSPQLYVLRANIDFSNNLWTAYLSGLPMFTNVQFNATGQSRTLGYIAAEWQLTGASTNDHGNNWMMVADWAVRAFPSSESPFSITNFTANTNGSHSVSWTGKLGFDYAVQYATNLTVTNWFTGLTNSVFTNILTTTNLTFNSSTNVECRYYRIKRTVTP